MDNYSIKEIECVSACHKVKGGFPYKWDMNVYRGCGHRCIYCFALYTHKYMNSDSFFNEIYVKTNIAEKLEKLLHSKSWKGEPINLGGVTDSYQPAEEKYRIMPDIWQILIKYKNPCIVSTKSDLILRDYDLIEKLSSITYVNIASTITCADEDIRREIEPGGVSSERRFEVLEAFKDTKAYTGLHVMPVIPFITATEDNIERIMSRGKKACISYAIVQALNLRGETKRVFLSFVQRKYPIYYKGLCDMYKTGYAPREYRNNLYRMTHGIMSKYGISDNYLNPMKNFMANKEKYIQTSLFD